MLPPRWLEKSTTIGYHERVVVLSWLFVPPIEADPDAVECAHGNASYVVVPRAPLEWSNPSSIYADMVLMTLVSVHIATLTRMNRRKQAEQAESVEAGTAAHAGLAMAVGGSAAATAVTAAAAAGGGVGGGGVGGGGVGVQGGRRIGWMTMGLVFSFRMGVLLCTALVMFSRRDVRSLPAFPPSHPHCDLTCAHASWWACILLNFSCVCG